MATYLQALLWAAAIILVAFASKGHWIPKDLASFLVLTLPVLGWLSIFHGKRAAAARSSVQTWRIAARPSAAISSGCSFSCSCTSSACSAPSSRSRRTRSRACLPILLAILPALPVIGIFWAVMRYLVEEPDEFMRLLLVRQCLGRHGLLPDAS